MNEKNPMEEFENLDQTLALIDVRTPVTAEQIVINIKDQIKSGDVNALKVRIMLKRFEKVSEEMGKDKVFVEMSEEEFSKYGSGTIQLFGAKIQATTVHTSFDFTECNDPIYNAWKEIEKRVIEARKAREEFLKTLIPKASDIPGTPNFANSGKMSINVETLPTLCEEPSGETVEVYAPKVYRKSGLKFMKV